MAIPAFRTDARDCPVSGASAAALAHYETALNALLTWRGGVDDAIERALADSPGFVMARVLQAWRLACTRDRVRVERARHLVAAARRWPALSHERLHLAALDTLLADDHPGAKAHLAACLVAQPRDLLALHAAHWVDHATGDLANLLARPLQVAAAWSPSVPGHGSLLAMRAFGLVENGDTARAADAVEAALAVDPIDVRAHHAMAHVFDFGRRPAEGLAWMDKRIARHGVGAHFVPHLWWHRALLHLDDGDGAAALRLFDDRVHEPGGASLAGLIDAAALLWRITLLGGDTGARWTALAAAWAPHVEDRFCSFNDVHAMLAFAGAGDTRNAARLERTLMTAQRQPTRHGEATRRIGLPACRGVRAFADGDVARAVRLLGALPEAAHRLGGSHAQRDVLFLTLQHAVERLRRRPASQLAHAAPARATAHRWTPALLAPRGARLAPGLAVAHG